MVTIERGSAMLSQQQRSDYEWYKDELESLYARHGHCFAVIRDKRVAATFETFGEAADHGLEEFGPREFIVQEIGPDESVHTMQLASMWVTP